MTEEQIKQKAEEYVDNPKSAWKQGKTCVGSVRQAFIDGYHEGFKDCAKARLNVTTISDCPVKDEWHYVKDGDFPKEKCLAVVFLDTGSIQSYLVKEITEEEMKNSCDIIKWKEIE